MSNVQILSRDPRVVLFHEFISNQERLHLLKLAEGRERPSTVVNHEDGSSVVSDYRTGYLAFIKEAEDDVVKEIQQRIAQITFTRTVQGEPLQVIGYKKNQQYKPHNDWFAPNEPGAAKHLSHGGQRIKTAMIYLRAPEKGGETDFITLGLRVHPEPGACLIWDNVYPATGQIDFRLLHTGRPVKRGEKIVATRWIRQRAYDGSENGLSPADLTQKLCAEQIETVLQRFNCRLVSMPYIAQEGPARGKILAESRVMVKP